MATRRRFRRQSRHLKKRRSHKYNKNKKSRRNYYNMRGGTPISIDIEIPKLIEAMKIKKLDNFDLSPLKRLGLDNDVLYIDDGLVRTMKLSILTGSCILSIGTLNGSYKGSFIRNTPTNTDYDITEDKKDEILKMVGIDIDMNDVYEA